MADRISRPPFEGHADRSDRDDVDGFDFRSLYADGLRHVQALCGDVWTDYNDHDPGVTILQQACYALSDVAYRIDFPLADLVADRSSRQGVQALYTGDRILTCDPVTIDDLRKLAYDAIHNLRNMWIEDVEVDKPRGLFRVYVEPYDYVFDPADIKTTDPRPALAKTLAANRPLGQDILDIVLLRRIAITLEATILIDTKSSANDIVASIIAAVQTEMVPAPTVRTIDALFADGVPPERVFDGPRLDIGTITSQVDRPRQIAIDDLEQMIRRQTGVLSIDHLQVTVDGQPTRNQTIDLGIDGIPGFEVDATIDAFRVLRGNVRQILDTANIIASAKYFETIQAQIDNDASRTLELNRYAAVPFGTRREQSDFTPIRVHFPAVYGVGPQGLPTENSATWIPTVSETARAVQADRLKTYLHGFDQIAGNILAQLEHVPDLFAIERSPGAPSYFPMAVSLDDPGRGCDAGRHEARLAEVMHSMDPSRTRREAMLDHLLARFDERFDDTVWERRTMPDAAMPLDFHRDRRILAKEQFLRSILRLGGKRGTGPDASTSGEARCAMARRIAFLAGLDRVDVVEHILLRNLSDDARGEQPLCFYEYRITILVLDMPDVIETGLKAIVETIVLENCPVHIESRVVWLGDDEMGATALLLSAWRDARRAALLEPTGIAAADAAAKALRLRLAGYWEQDARANGDDERQGAAAAG